MSKTATERRIHFDNIVKKAEADFKNNPSAYKNKLKRLTLLGYGYLFFILLLCLGFMAGLIFLAINSTVFLLLLIKKKLIVVVLIVMYGIFKSLYIKIPAPEGLRVKKKDSPELFATIKKMEQDLDTPHIHEIVITPELNASIQQTPRLGIFGWHKNSLILGAELLMILNKDQALAVVAHEMGHLSGGHSKFNGKIYRVRMSWMNILYTVAHINAVAKWVFGKFFTWYAPYFNAYSFALARANEYEADEIAAKTTSANNLAQALVGINVVGQSFFSKYWTDLEKQAISSPKLNKSAYTNIKSALSEFKFNDEKVKAIIKKCMKAKTNHDDTHPALQDRIKAIGGDAQFVFDAKESAALQWFGHGFDDIMDTTGTSWATWNKPRWEEIHDQGKMAQKRLDELNNQENLNKDELVEKGNIQLFLEGRKSALKTYKEVFELDNNNPFALYHLGSALLDKDNDKGLKFLEKLMFQEDFMNAAGQRLYEYYDLNDMSSDAERIQLKLEAKYDEEDAFYDEISSISINDEYYRFELSEEEQEHLATSIKKYSGIKHVWYAGRKLKTRPDEKMLIIIFELHSGETEETVFADSEYPIVFEGYYFMVNSDNKKIVKNIAPYRLQLY